MSKFYPRGFFGPVCDIQPSDDSLRTRPRKVPEDEEDDRYETIPIDIDFPDVIKEFDPPPPYLIGRKCKRRELPDGTFEYYDCIDEYNYDYPPDRDLIDRITDVVDLFPSDPIFFVPEITPISCNPFDPNINILPETMVLSDGTLAKKYYYANSSPPTFPVDADAKFTFAESSNQFSFTTGSGSGGTYPITVAAQGTNGRGSTAALKSVSSNVIKWTDSTSQMDTDAELKIVSTDSGTTASFSGSNESNLELNVTGGGNVTLEFEWDDDVNANGQAVGALTINGQTYNQTGDEGDTTITIGSTTLNLVVGGTGQSNINITLDWDDNPSTYGQALGSVSIAGATWTQTSGVRKGSDTKTLSLTPGTYAATITGGSGYGGFTLKNGNTEVCFKDLDGNDCNALLKFGQQTGITTVQNDSAWSDEGNSYAVWVNPEVCTLPLQTQTITYYIEIPTTATYAFRMGSDDRMTVTLDDSDVILDNQAGGIFRHGSLNTPYTATRTFTGGTTLKLVVDVYNSAASPNNIDADGNPFGKAYLWTDNPGGYFIKICRGNKCFEASNVTWVPSGPHVNWGDLMSAYSVYPSSNDVLTGIAHTTSWNLKVPFTGNYLLEYAVDNTGTLALNGSTIASFSGFTTTQSQTITLAEGGHVLTGTCTNVDNGRTWEGNPAGLAWKLSYPSANANLTAKFKPNGSIQVDGTGSGDLALNFAWNENNQTQTTTSNINAQFNNGTGLVVGGTGTGTVTLRFEWDDNPNTYGQALGTWSIGGVGFVQTDTEEASVEKTLSNAQVGTYKTVIVGNTGSLVRENNNKDLVFDDNPSNGFDENARLKITSGDAYFNSSGDLVVNTAGNIRFKFEWDDNPNTSGKALDHIVVGVDGNNYFTQSLGVSSGSSEITLNVEAGKTYAATLTHQTGGYRIEGNATRVCFKDRDGSDCNATLRIKNITNSTTTTALNADTALGTYSVGSQTFTQTSAESGSASGTIRVEAGRTYPAVILRNPNGFVRQNNNQQLGFKDSGGVKATVTLGSITTQEIVVGTSRDRNTSGDGNLFWHTRIGAGYRISTQPYQD